MSFRVFISVGLVAGLAGCGGSGNSNLGGDELPGPPEFNEIILETIELAEKFEGLDPSGSLPTGDDVNYEGTFTAVNTFGGATSGLTSAMTLNMDFVSGEMTGQTDQLYVASVDADGNFNGPGLANDGLIEFASDTITESDISVLMVGSNIFFDGAPRAAFGIAEGEFRGDDGDMFVFEGPLTIGGVGFDFEATGIAD